MCVPPSSLTYVWRDITVGGVPPASVLATSPSSATPVLDRANHVLVLLDPSPLRDSLEVMLAKLRCPCLVLAPGALSSIPPARLVLCGEDLYRRRRSEFQGRQVVVIDHALMPNRTLPAAEVASLLAQSGTQDAASPALSPREVEMLRYASQGLSNDQIAAECFIGVATVKTHLLRVYRKLGVPDRAAAVYRALKLGVID